MRSDHGRPATATPQELLDLVAQGTAFFLDQLGAPDEEHLRQDSLLPGWTRAHVAGHVARNADALGNLLHWARTGEETPMYADAGQRAADIESSARKSAADLVLDVRRTADVLQHQLLGLSETDWGNTVRTAQGRTIEATKIPWLRVREVWLHAVDLGDDSTAVDGLPRSLVDGLLDEIVMTHGSRPDATSFTLAPTDRDRRWSTTPGDPRSVVVQAPAARLLAWVTGRDRGDTLHVDRHASLPHLAAWL